MLWEMVENEGAMMANNVALSTVAPLASDGASMAANMQSGRETPLSQRRPLHVLPSASALANCISPTKRRKQCHAEESPVKPACGSSKREEQILTPLAQLLQADAKKPLVADWNNGPLLHEVFCRLGSRDLVERVGPVSKLWCEISHSQELWAVLRRHLKLRDQLVKVEKVVDRRSKGRLLKCRRLGCGEMALLRVVNLELTNAGKDDGIPTSFLREAALLGKLRHPNVVRLIGSEVIGREAMMCTEFIYESFANWFKVLEARPSFERLVDIRGKFRQVLTGLSYVHHQGLMHRNLKPDNIFLTQDGVVKLGDFTTTRMLDIPFQPYTPEDPKERDRSGREMRRLWYRAPELTMRDEIYGPKVDIWSVGCLIAEAATAKPVFPADSEIDHLFRTFRLIGTPTMTSWPEVLTMKNFSPKFPIYSRMSFPQIARAACCGVTSDEETLVQQAKPDRVDVLQNMLGVAAVLGPDGMFTLDRMLAVPPGTRGSADALLEGPLFGTPLHANWGCHDGTEMHAMTSHWLHGRLVSPNDSSMGANSPHPRKSCRRLDDTPPVEMILGDGSCFGSSSPSSMDCPTSSVPESMISSGMLWNILLVMQQRERGCSSEVGGASSWTPPTLPPNFEKGARAVLVDFLIGLASNLCLTDYTTHLAVCVLDKYLGQHEGPIATDKLQIVGATCLKVSDVFAEQSREYYKQENAVEYAEAMAMFHQASPQQMLSCEKDVLPKLDFDLCLPTVHWFLQSYLAYAMVNNKGSAAKTTFFIGDLSLLDYDLLQYGPSLRAQCALLLAVFLTQQADKKRPIGRAVSAPDVADAAGASAIADAEMNDEPVRSASDSIDVRCSSMDEEHGAEGPISLAALAHWDEHVRDHVCQHNTAVDAAMCLQAMVRTLVERRREWKSARLAACETKHAALSRTLAYPEHFPVSQIVRYLLPDSQRSNLR